MRHEHSQHAPQSNIIGCLGTPKEYSYWVTSTGDWGNQAVSPDGTFTTAGERAGMPAWTWIPIGLAVGAGVLGGTAYTISARAASLNKLRIC